MVLVPFGLGSGTPFVLSSRWLIPSAMQTGDPLNSPIAAATRWSSRKRIPARPEARPLLRRAGRPRAAHPLQKQ